MKNYLRNWNIMRVLRLALGIFVIVQGVMDQQWILAILGGMFALMPLMNVGCCGVSGCSTPIAKSNKKLEEVRYEEVR
ncbi:hypothetical protein [Sphingobacterium faecale]|uniref:DUF2892 domain-containing protein n=1 Tax=Sphingobacterium faecale TaxID=2803775 RepID=A0ABS1R5S4_9SPHI|nr:hypothetical protein [Sphingobacterium faecale]MBL1410060.1 hypothetical protein [Sphingobacterium faecale]